jgi:hypothetical protein
MRVRDEHKSRVSKQGAPRDRTGLFGPLSHLLRETPSGAVNVPGSLRLLLMAPARAGHGTQCADTK